MWRAVQAGRTGSKPVSLEVGQDDDLAKAKPLRSVDDSAWIRKGYVVACFALLALFLFSGLLTHIGRSLAPSAPNVLKYVTTFNAENFLDRFNSEVEPDEDSIADLPVDGFVSNPGSNLTKQRSAGCNERDAKLKVFMYDLPPEFHYGMMADFVLESKQQVWPKNVSSLPKYPGGLYQQHSPEYWLISDLLTSDMPDRSSPCTAFRVRRWQDADVILVPFFASLSYNKYSRPASYSKHLDMNQKLQVKLVSFLKAQPAWQASNGEDHVVVIHHPNSMVYKREQFRNVMFVVADFGRYGAEVANIRKDVVAPYKHVIPNFDEDLDSAASFQARPTLLFFQGAIVRKEGGIIRQQLYELLREEPDVVFATGATTSEGIRTATQGMRQSKFCLHLAGDTPSSNRLFDAVASHCVPLIISDEIELPFEDVLDYSEFCLFMNSTDALRKGFVTDLLRKFTVAEWTRMHQRMRQVQHHFQYQHPTALGDAVHMTWDAISRKVPAIILAQNKRRRYQRSEITPQPKQLV
ncbi:hypothetical protein M758_5G079700 [Ceratodon purpureus]|nr:hypothetical protein M758_5G079700 [Ceratodon purpureus]